MATIPCPQCDKTFRGESGLNWHLERIHGQSRESDQLGHRVDVAGDHVDLRDTVNVLQERVDDIAISAEEIAGKLSALDAMAVRIRALEVGLSIATEDISRLRTQVETLKTGLRDAIEVSASARAGLQLHDTSPPQGPAQCIGVRPRVFSRSLARCSHQPIGEC